MVGIRKSNKPDTAFQNILSKRISDERIGLGKRKITKGKRDPLNFTDNTLRGF